MDEYISRNLFLDKSIPENINVMADIIFKDKYQYDFFKKGLKGYEEFDINKIREYEKAAKKYLPVLLDEISIFSRITKISYEKMLYFVFYGGPVNNCSAFSVLSDITSDNCIYSGHSYEWIILDEHLHIMNMNNDIRYMGFSLFYFGRWNGLNSYGLSINQTGINSRVENSQIFPNHLIVRILLANCKTTKEAIELFKEIPKAGWGATMLITDSRNDSVLINYSGPSFGIQEIDKKNKKFLVSTNHYSISSMYEIEKNHGVHSLLRYNAINDWIGENKGSINHQKLKELQSLKFPQGPCCHHYKEGLGTIRSVIYNNSRVETYICSGSPILNEWQKYDFKTAYDDVMPSYVKYLDEDADPYVWKQLAPGQLEY